MSNIPKYVQNLLKSQPRSQGLFRKCEKRPWERGCSKANLYITIYKVNDSTRLPPSNLVLIS